MKKKLIFFGIIGLAVYGLIALIRWDPNGSTSASNSGTSDNVVITDGTQFIDLTAKGGYSPRKTIAQAGIPTVLKIITNGTYDCSSSINIPQAKVNTYLPPSGTTDIDLGIPAVGSIAGSCSMGMYSFGIEFKG